MESFAGRPDPAVHPAPATRRRSRVHRFLSVPIIIVLNLTLNVLLWEVASLYLEPELGAVSKLPDGDMWSSAEVRIGFRAATIFLTWIAGYDHFDVAALTVLSLAPYAYLLVTYYNITAQTVAVLVNIEVLSMAIPTYFLRRRTITSSPNRYLLSSRMVQGANAALAGTVYGVVVFYALKTGFLNNFLVSHFDIPTLEVAHAESPFTIGCKVLVTAIAACSFLLNPSMVAQPSPGTDKPSEQFDPANATLRSTVEHNFWNFSRGIRSLIKQTIALTFFVLLNTTQRCMTLQGSETKGSFLYALLWAAVNGLISCWYAWTGNTSLDYEVN